MQERRAFPLARPVGPAIRFPKAALMITLAVIATVLLTGMGLRLHGEDNSLAYHPVSQAEADNMINGGGLSLQFSNAVCDVCQRRYLSERDPRYVRHAHFRVPSKGPSFDVDMAVCDKCMELLHNNDTEAIRLMLERRRTNPFLFTKKNDPFVFVEWRDADPIPQYDRQTTAAVQ
jgi:hypothetical protein